MAHVDPHILESFRLMWNLYPGPVMLIHKDREILALNKAAKELGISAGIKCHSLYPSETPCPGCLANAALKQGEAKRKAAYSEQFQQFLDGFWVPLDGVDDVYVHFGNDITQYVREEFLPTS